MPTYPWDRRKKESSKHYDIFIKYVELGMGNRSVDNLLEKHPDIKLKKKTIHNISSKWEWVKRAEAYDEHETLERHKRYEGKLNVILDTEVERLVDRLKYINENIIELNNNYDGSKQTSISHSLAQNVNAHKSTLEELFMITGKPTEIRDVKNNTTLKGKLEHNTSIEYDAQAHREAIEDLLQKKENKED